MKKKQWLVIPLIIVLVFIALGSLVVDFTLGDLNCDSTKELLVITRKIGQMYGNKLVVVSLCGVNREIVRIYHMDDLRPWQVHITDVDGDGISELSLGVYKKTRLDPQLAKRPFLYNFNSNGLSPKWLGSRLARPFDKYIFYNMDSSMAEELISIEDNENNKKLINIYTWKGFGFESLGQSRFFDDISCIKKTKDKKIKAKVKILDKWEWLYISLKGNEIAIDYCN